MQDNTGDPDRASVGFEQDPVDQRPKPEPAFNLPSTLVAIIVVLFAIHAVRTYLIGPELDEQILIDFAFFPARYDTASQYYELLNRNLAWLWSPVTYSFLHGGWQHLLFNSFWMVAFGAPVVWRIGTPRLALFWCVTAIGAMVLHVAFHWGEAVPVIGASGVVAGLMGAAARFVFTPTGRIRRTEAHLNPRLSIAECLKNRSVLVFAGIWFATNLAIGLGVFALGGDGAVAWEAHIGGFLFGFFLFSLFDPQPR